MERVQVRDLKTAPAVRPQARPVDTFIAPAAQAPSTSNPLIDLAGALDQINPTLQRYFAEEQERISKEDLAEGQRAYAENRAKFKDAVEQGVIPAGASPHFRRGYKQAELRNLGFTFDQKLREAYAQSEVVNSDDPEALNAFMAEFRSQFMEENVGDSYDDIDVVEAFLPQTERSLAVLAQRHVEQRIKAIEDGYAQEFESEVFSSLDNFAEQPEGFDAAQAAGLLNGRLNEVIANGMNKTQANKTLVDAITNKAIDAGDMDLLDVLDEIDAGPGSKLGNTKYARQKREAAEDAITRDIQNQERYEHWKVSQAREEASRAITSQAFDKIIENPGANINAELQQLRRVDPGAAASLLSFQQSKLSADNRVIERPAIVAGLYEQLDDPNANHAAIISQYAASRMINASTAESAHRYARQTRDFNKPLQDRTFTSAVSDLERIINGDEFSENSVTRFRANQAARELRSRFVGFLEKNPEAGDLEKSEFLDQQIEKMVRSPRWSGQDVATEINRSEPTKTTTGGVASPQNAPQPSNEAIKYLRDNPSLWRQFEQKYGQGSSIPYLKAPEFPETGQ